VKKNKDGQVHATLSIDFTGLPEWKQRQMKLFGQMKAEGPITDERLEDLKKIWVFFSAGKPLRECG
jgi:hypothetical protein